MMKLVFKIKKDVKAQIKNYVKALTPSTDLSVLFIILNMYKRNMLLFTKKERQHIENRFKQAILRNSKRG